VVFLVTEAASDLLDGLSMYGENSPYGDYLRKASTYLDQYGQKHEVPVAQGSTKPPSGKIQFLNSCYNVMEPLFLCHLKEPNMNIQRIKKD